MQADVGGHLSVEDLLPAPPPTEPASVVFEQPVMRYAGWWRRVGANVIDNMIVSVALFFLSGALGLTAGSEAASVVLFLIMILGVAAYFIALNMNGEATIGRRVLGIRIQLEGGGDLGFGVAALRLVATPISWMSLMLGFLWPLWDEKKQSFHDKVALTVVVET